MEKLLVVGENPGTRSLLSRVLDRRYTALHADDRISALQAFLETRPSVVLVDVGVSSHSFEEYLALIRDLVSIEPLVKIVVIGTSTAAEFLQQVLALGVYDTLMSPTDTDKLRLVVDRAVYVNKLERERHDSNQCWRGDPCEGLLGSCQPMRAVLAAIRQVAMTNSPVLIVGEKGTGKKLAARAIHHCSRRKDGPFESIDCGAALSENDAGHDFFIEEAADGFSGGTDRSRSSIERATGGTLFLHDVASMPPAAQTKLLRILRRQSAGIVANIQPNTPDVRILAASTTDFQRDIHTAGIPEDLYYHLAPVQITMPPLRQRGDDVILLAHAFLNDLIHHTDRRELTFSADALHGLRRYHWPGNVAELQTRIRLAITKGYGNWISAADLFDGTVPERTPTRSTSSLRKVRALVDRDMIQQELRKHGGNISAASVGLGISRPTLYTLMQKLGVDRHQAS